jgi:phage host-nuclease inhibitor protein Gam
MTPKDQADALLGEIRRLTEDLAELSVIAEKQINKVKARYADKLSSLKADIKSREDALIKIGLKHKGDIFGEFDYVIIANGRLDYKRSPWVVRAKGVKANIQKIGRFDLLKITEAPVDWNKVTKEPDDVLEKLGTRRKMKDDIEYQLKKD